jgi:DnaJ-class molecular chaperone
VTAVPCPDCEGTGASYYGPADKPISERVDSGRPCPRCEGSGSVPSRCPTCGSRDRSIAWKPCSTAVVLAGVEMVADPWHGGGSDTRKDAP